MCCNRVLKLLSEDPAHYRDAPLEGIRRILEEVTGEEHPRNKPLETSRIRSIRMGTTVRLKAPPFFVGFFINLHMVVPVVLWIVETVRVASLRAMHFSSSFSEVGC